MVEGGVQRARWRSLEGGMRRPSRYLATVRRATWMPRLCRVWDRLWSDNGLRGSSASMSLRSIAWIAVAEALPPSSVDTPLEKKYLSSNVPRGVCRYLRVVTREMV